MIANPKNLRATQFVVGFLFVTGAISMIAVRAIIPSVAIFLSNDLTTFFQIVAVAGIASGFMCLIPLNNLIVLNIANIDAKYISLEILLQIQTPARGLNLDLSRIST